MTLSIPPELKRTGLKTSESKRMVPSSAQSCENVRSLTQGCINTLTSTVHSVHSSFYGKLKDLFTQILFFFGKENMRTFQVPPKI